MSPAKNDAPPPIEKVGLSEAWHLLKNDLRQKNKMMIGLALEKAKLDETNGKVLVITQGTTQFDALMEERSEMLSFLKARCLNTEIEMDIKLEIPVVQESSKPYTNKEIFEQILKAHPGIEKNLKELGMEPD